MLKVALQNNQNAAAISSSGLVPTHPQNGFE
jgi:hypothetical protein